MKKNYKIIFTLILIVSAYGVNKTGTTSAKFLSIGVGSNAVGMGGAYTAVADDATAALLLLSGTIADAVV